jgi:hypothetical protein
LARLKAVSARLGFGVGRHLRLRGAYRLGDSKVRVTLDGLPIEITLGLDDKRLRLYPETRINHLGEAIKVGSFVIVDPRHPLSPDWRVSALEPEELAGPRFGRPRPASNIRLPGTGGWASSGLDPWPRRAWYSATSDAGTTIAPIVEQPKVIA